MTDSTYTDITVILDRSGSMQAIKSDTEGGLNAFVAEQREAEGTCRISLVQFDDRYETVYTAKPVADAPATRLHPRGMTALLDAVGRAVTETGERLAALVEDERPGTVIIVIVTDGLENSSHEWTREQVFEAVTRQTNDYGWTFTYIGANQDAIAVGSSLGVPTTSSLTFDPTKVGDVFAGTSAAVLRTRGGQSYGYTEAERSAARS